MEIHEPETIFERVIHYDEPKQFQIRLTINIFKDVEYLHLRKYYLDFDGETWLPTPEGVAMPLDFSNSKELFIGLVEILSLAESKDVLLEHFKDVLNEIFVK